MSNDLKNQLIDLLSSNDYDINFNTYETIKSLIINEENPNDISNENLVLIRILSKEEYDKYIVNGTLNGSITTGNINVWRYEGPKNLFAGRLDIYSSGGGAPNTNVAPSSYQTAEYIDCIANNKNYYSIHYFYRSKANLNLESCLNNNNNKNGLYYISTASFGYYCPYNPYYDGYNHPTHQYVTLNKLLTYVSKNQANYFLYASYQVPGSASLNNHSGGNATALLLYICPTFRPVFQYKDNNKSKNIYY